MNLKRIAEWLPLAALTASGYAAATDAIGDAIAAGTANLELRYRFENVVDDAKTRDANASTLRTRLRYVTGSWQDTTATVELDNVSSIGPDRYFDLRNGRFSYPAVYDPDGSDLNQAFVRYSGVEKTQLTVGRQKVAFDNQRFVGVSPWRQNEQSFDAAALEYKGIERLTATWVYANRFNTTLGPEDVAFMPPSDYAMKSNLLNVKYAARPELNAVGYYYALDFVDVPANSTTTAGVRLTGEVPVGSLTAGYTAEYAMQQEYADNPASFSADFWEGELRLGTSQVVVALGRQDLGVDQGVAFDTPLATRKFHGYAERFFLTPGTGMKDTWVKLTAKKDAWGLELSARDLRAGIGDNRYGSEVDVQLTRAFGKRYLVLLQYADYQADNDDTPMLGGFLGPNEDLRKAWLMLQAKF